MEVHACRFTARSLAAMVLMNDDAEGFALLTGVGDTSTYRDDAPLPSWLVPEGDQQKCYVADEDVRPPLYPCSHSASPPSHRSANLQECC